MEGRQITQQKVKWSNIRETLKTNEFALCNLRRNKATEGTHRIENSGCARSQHG